MHSHSSIKLIYITDKLSISIKKEAKICQNSNIYAIGYWELTVILLSSHGKNFVQILEVMLLINSITLFHSHMHGFLLKYDYVYQTP